MPEMMPDESGPAQASLGPNGLSSCVEKAGAAWKDTRKCHAVGLGQTASAMPAPPPGPLVIVGSRWAMIHVNDREPESSPAAGLLYTRVNGCRGNGFPAGY